MKHELLVSLAFVSLTSCGVYDPPTHLVAQLSSEQMAPFLSAASSYFATEYGISDERLDRQAVYVRTPDDTQAICRATEPVCSCNLWFRIVVSSDCQLCESIVHEYGHAASEIRYGDWDQDHSHFGTWNSDRNRYEYLFPFTLCER